MREHPESEAIRAVLRAGSVRKAATLLGSSAGGVIALLRRAGLNSTDTMGFQPLARPVTRAAALALRDLARHGYHPHAAAVLLNFPVEMLETRWVWEWPEPAAWEFAEPMAARPAGRTRASRGGRRPGHNQLRLDGFLAVS